MGWRNWPSWLKGGIIGLLVGIIYFFFFYFIRGYHLLPINEFAKSLFNISSMFVILNLVLYLRWVYIPRVDNNDLLGWLVMGGFNYFVFFLTLIEFFVMGLVIGFIVGRIKARRAVSRNL